MAAPAVASLVTDAKDTKPTLTAFKSDAKTQAKSSKSSLPWIECELTDGNVCFINCNLITSIAKLAQDDDAFSVCLGDDMFKINKADQKGYKAMEHVFCMIRERCITLTS